MALFGPTDVEVTLDAINTAQDTVSAAVDLDEITEIDIPMPEAVVVPGTRLGDNFESELSTGVQRFADIVIRGFRSTSSSGTFRRIGRPAKVANYPKRTLTVTHRTGTSQAIEVFVKKNDPTISQDGVAMFEAVLGVAAQESSDYTETGF